MNFSFLLEIPKRAKKEKIDDSCGSSIVMLPRPGSLTGAIDSGDTNKSNTDVLFAGSSVMVPMPGVCSSGSSPAKNPNTASSQLTFFLSFHRLSHGCHRCRIPIFVTVTSAKEPALEWIRKDIFVFPAFEWVHEEFFVFATTVEWIREETKWIFLASGIATKSWIQ
mmetsp:Transcript_19092/g.39287  ORF Transcript_19092/g.39287 Transcript_19092/m.39287 type:complete len:166 (-) Transcript_19092:1158-1655(-)